MKRIFFVSIISLMVFVLSSCKEKALTMDDNGKTIELKTGETFTVNLRGSASTGNYWKIVEIDKGIVIEDIEHTFSADNNKTGAAGTYTYHFKAVSNGESTLKMVYGPKSNPELKPRKTFSIKLIVK
jgi:predicted secreted protein